MKQRVLTGVLGAAGFLFLLWLGNWWYSAGLIILATISYLEFCRMQDLSWKQFQVIIGLGFVWLLILTTGLDQQLPLPSFPIFGDLKLINFALVLFLILIVLTRNQFDIHQMAYLFVGALYIGYGFAYMIQTIWRTDGLALTLLIILVIWATDSGALFLGKRFGKKKLWPDISPNKTVEGSIGGLVFGVIMSIIVLQFFPKLGTLPAVILLGFVISFSGQVGDLIESAWKRTTGVKDTGTILPGHGGILDRFDSLLFTFIILHLLEIV
ncbi:phosphatidate cytidylyltransferase [Thermoflavimicrobium daqui]|jgi:phosphatidate cytidylyltransferase|uniref:Phosphatidate cytidylyltransferase n=1 Tax=Thermoflavimicrobium daqui TaxID=2137476 RepID=A0A364K7Q5_9BACL|nr:phosphatidate cytidylyltransferase [Thermoflavimicrobium daqui]RAL26323.1 phosphatidate cytidylyltransferase [Thermoflavimicrobium daqui]